MGSANELRQARIARNYGRSRFAGNTMIVSNVDCVTGRHLCAVCAGICALTKPRNGIFRVFEKYPKEYWYLCLGALVVTNPLTFKEF